MVNIRFYKVSDYQEVKQVLQEADLFDETWEAPENLAKKIKKDKESILVAEFDGEVIGCVFIVEDGWTAAIWRLAVRKDQRRKGIGKQLMEKAEQIVRDRGLKEVSLLVNTNNQMLKTWYEKQDYEASPSDYTFMYKELN
jgi:ribosomal protein S18 acetylase RimI-like enzyme